MTRILGCQSDPTVQLPDPAEPSHPCCGQTSFVRQALRNADIQKLGQASDLTTLMSSFAAIASSLTATGSPFALVRSDTAAPTAVFPPAYGPDIAERNVSLTLQGQPSLGEKLGRGEHIVIRGLGTDPRAKPKQQQCLVVFPVAHRPDVMVLLCVAVREGEELPARELELLHLLCNITAPLVARIQQVQELENKAGAYDKMEKRAVQLEKRLQGLAQEKQEAQSVDHQMRSLLLSNVAHELRTPLVAIRGYTKMILEGRAGEVNGTQHEYLSIVAENADKLVALTGNLSRLTSSQQLRTELFDLCALLRDGVQKIAEVSAQKSILLTSTIPPEPFRVFGDREKLGQVIGSMLLNALEYTQPGGKIAVSLSRGRNGEAIITMSDTGPGIPKELVDKLFDSYRRPRNGAEPNGIGLGLAVVHDIVYLHGGRISVSSKMGQGSTFSIILPAITVEGRRPNN